MKSKILTIILLILVVAGTWVYVTRKASNRETGSASNLVNTINGVLNKPEIAKRRPIGIVIENHPEARPQSGLSEADIVYEILTEGGITRFLAIFQNNEPRQIGPIRSARPTFNFLANSWSAAFAHVGGSDQALEELSADKYKSLTDINEFYNGDYFNRDNQRTAPHNVYTSIPKIREYLNKKGASSWSKIDTWKFADAANNTPVQETTEIDIPFSGNGYAVTYKYDPTKNEYERYIGGKKAIDNGNSSVISPKNIIVLFADAEYLPVKDTTTVIPNLTEAGQAYVFNNGRLQKGAWEHSDGKLSLLNENNTDLPLQPGQIWVSILPREMMRKVTWK